MSNKTGTVAVALALAITLASSGSAPAQAQQSATPASGGHVAFMPADVQWGSAPPSLPPGAQAAVLEGNPSQTGPFTLRLKLPANYKIAPHTHPAIERVTVLSGTLNLGMGERFDETKAKAMSAGSFFMMPPGMQHFAFTGQETVLQLNGTGPWGINYLNPADDPRNAAGR